MDKPPGIFSIFAAILPLWIILKLFILNLKVTHRLLNMENPLYFQQFRAYSQIHSPYDYCDENLFIYISIIPAVNQKGSYQHL